MPEQIKFCGKHKKAIAVHELAGSGNILHATSKLVCFCRLAFKLLFFRGRWIFWFFGFLFFVKISGTITAIRMEIPSLAGVGRISGVFVDSSLGHGRTGLFGIHIKDFDGKIHKCSCEPLSVKFRAIMYPVAAGRCSKRVLF